MERKRTAAIAFVWDNFGPVHTDRCEAVSAAGFKIVAVELFRRSRTYDWTSEAGSALDKTTLFEDGTHRTGLRMAFRIWRACRAGRANHVFLCHYEMPGIFLSALLLRLTGVRTYAMGCSKFDDTPRHVLRELGKRLFLLPYRGAIASGTRSRDYMRWLGIPESRIRTDYNTLSVSRIRRMAGIAPAPDGADFDERHFTVVARLVDKKNLFATLDAYAAYHRTTPHPRKLRICGSGPLETALREKVAALDLQSAVVFEGFLQTADIARVLGTTLALLLLSVEEQFGNVVIEAQAMGVPVIVSDACGARDRLVRSGCNGFVVEPDNPQGTAFFMALLSQDRQLWSAFAERSLAGSAKGDVSVFASAVRELVGE